MNIRYAVMVLTGINDPSKMLRRAEQPSVFWETFADAKAEAVARADDLRQYLESSDRNFEMQCDSGERRFEIRFAYGPSSREPDRPWKMVFDVCCCSVNDSESREIEL
jgi:hypothetical protein